MGVFPVTQFVYFFTGENKIVIEIAVIQTRQIAGYHGIIGRSVAECLQCQFTPHLQAHSALFQFFQHQRVMLRFDYNNHILVILGR